MDKDEGGGEDEADVHTSNKPSLASRTIKGESSSAVALWPQSVVSAREKLAVRPSAGSSTDRFPTMATSSVTTNAIPSLFYNEEKITRQMNVESTKGSPIYSNPNQSFSSELFSSKSHKRKTKSSSDLRRKLKTKDFETKGDIIIRSDNDTSSSSSLNSLGEEEEEKDLLDTSKRQRKANNQS